MSVVTSTSILTKQPSEKRKYSFVFDNLMDDVEVIDTITRITSEVVGSDATSDLVITNSGIADASTIDDVDYRSGVIVDMWISSGTNGNKYRIEALVETDSGQILEGDGLLRVKNT